MNKLILKYFQYNIAGLLCLGVTLESALVVLQFHFINLVTLLVVIMSSLFFFVGFDRQTIAVLAISLMLLCYILYDRRYKNFLFKISKPNIEIHKTFAVGFMLGTHLLTIFLVCIVGYLSFGIG